MFVTLVQGGSGARQLYGTTGPNFSHGTNPLLDGVEKNFYYHGQSDTLHLENIDIGGSITIGGSSYTTIGTGSGTSGTANTYVIESSQGGSSDEAYIEGFYTVGVPYGVLATDWSSNSYNVLTWQPSGISVQGYGHFTDDVRITDGDLVVRNSSNDIVAFIDTSGNGVFTGDVTTNYSSSDIALKENIVVIPNPLDKIDQISGYTFNYIDKPDETVPGVIAQEVEQVLPGVVYDHERNGKTYKAVRYDQLIPLLIESIKELKFEIEQLKK